jgi:eukaryotic-like serine/threonine-protein kinase
MMFFRPGTWLGRYELLAELGRGGMGAVFRARDQDLDREVAIKVLSPLLAGDPGFVERFRREARLVAGLRHPNIVVLFDWGNQDGVPYLVMELLDGLSLRQRIGRDGRLPLSTVLDLVRQCADALDYAHQRGIVHRDVKPGNVMVDAAEHATLTDFGIARALSGSDLTIAGGIIGTPEYLSPEQALGQPVDARSDVYSLGIMAYELLVGRVPFQSDSTPAILHLQAYAAPPPLATICPDLPAPATAVLDRVLAKNPGDRYPSGGQFARDLEAALASADAALAAPSVAHRPSLTPPRIGRPSTPPPAAPASTSAPAPVAPPRPASRRWRAPLLGLLGLAGALAGLLLAWPLLEPRPPATPPTLRPTALPPAVAGLSPSAAGPSPSASPLAAIPSPLVPSKPSPSPAVAPDPTVMLGIALRENLNESIARYREALVQDPDNSLAHFLLGVALGWQIQPEAVPQLEAATRLDPGQGAAWAYLAAVYHDQAQYDRAAAAVERAVQTGPNLSETHAVLAIQRLEANDLPGARAATDRALQADPAGELAQSLNYQTLLLAGDLPGALTQARKFVAQHPTWAIAHRYLARAYLEQGQTDQARQELQYAQQFDPRTMGLNSGLGWLLLTDQKYDQAERAFQADLQLNDRYVDALLGHGWARYNQKDYPAALADFRRATEIDVRNSRAFSAVGWVLTNVDKQYLEAEANFRKALELFPPNHQAILGLGLSQYYRAQYEPALTSFRAASEQSPPDAYAHLWTGATLLALHRLPEARQSLEKADSIKPNDPSIQLELDRLKAAGG